MKVWKDGYIKIRLNIKHDKHNMNTMNEALGTMKRRNSMVNVLKK